MLEFLVYNIFVVFAGKVFQQTCIPMSTNCVPLLADIFLYLYEADFIASLLSTGKKQLASRFDLTYRYIDDVLSMNNPEFKNYLGQMYPVELEIKDTTESTTSAYYLDLLLSIWRDGQLYTSVYDKGYDFNIHIKKTFRSGVVISHLRRPIACLSLNLYDTPGLAPLMNVLFWGPGNFPVSYLNRDSLCNAWNRHSGSFWSIRGSYSAIWSNHLANVKWHSNPWPTVTFQPIRLSTNFIILIPSLIFTE